MMVPKRPRKEVDEGVDRRGGGGGGGEEGSVDDDCKERGSYACNLAWDI